MDYRALDGQSIYDIAMILYGDLSYTGKLLFDNGLTLSDSIAGKVLTYDPTVKTQSVFQIAQPQTENPNKVYSTHEGQSWYDVALMTDGNLEGVINMLYKNSLEVASKMATGIKVAYTDLKDQITQYTKVKNIVFNTGIYAGTGYVTDGYVDVDYVL